MLLTGHDTQIPAAKAIGVKIGGWHDLRHTMNRMMRRIGVDPVARSGVMGHKNVELAQEVYDKASQRTSGSRSDFQWGRHAADTAA